MAGVNLGEPARGRIDKTSGIRPAFLLAVGAPAVDGAVGPQATGVERTGGDLEERTVRIACGLRFRSDNGCGGK